MLSNRFPVGTNITVFDKQNPPTALLDRPRIPEVVELAKEYLKKAGRREKNDYMTLHLEEPFHIFAVLPAEPPAKDIFVWVNADLFTIEVVDTLVGINKVARTPKLFCVLENDEYYYYRLQDETIVTLDDVTIGEVENIRYFEHGIGLLYDTSRMPNG